ncbi:TRAP transporter large permease [Maritalea mediterranea]|uniref:TRAP transporter large permease subunit n=1 Tax=Maritalea mediterranea TaxID=2909667 RepID=A0ABS9E2H6_9HYPH|nr:TRAP transporter large permease subunit [Maritalea mediterranea]MCF4097061.1 TRAP transporter large permease subunit [Maritalea mediterranea]
MFAALIAAILSGFPVAFSIAGVAVIFAFIGAATGVMDIGLLGASGQRIFGLLTNNVLIAIPLFVLMGAVLEKSKIAEDLLQTMGKAFGSFRGGLGISVVLVGALLAASTGIVGATVVAMGMIALPAMLRANYNKALAAGTVCTAGTLGQIIPPSTLLIILSDVMSNGFQQAQYEQGKFVVETLSVGQIFAAALVPGLLLVVLYILYLVIRGFLRPEELPALPQQADQNLWREALSAILPPVALIVAVLGSILTGVATPTEAASVGAAGALFMAAFKNKIGGPFLKIGLLALLLLVIGSLIHPIRLQRSDVTGPDFAIGMVYVVLALIGGAALLFATYKLIKLKVLQPALLSTTTMTAMIFATILAAGMFSLVFIGLGGEDRVSEILANMPGGAFGALVFSMVIIFILGFFLDFVEISVIVLPLVVPGLILLGHDPIWLTVIIAINLQTSFLTPPFGFSLFYLRGAAPKEISTGDIYRGVLPYIGLQVVGVALIWLFPILATALPEFLF